jgi:hypothetical protein
VKLRLTAPIWKTFTGALGVIVFENGLSTTDVLETDATQVASLVGAEWEDGETANVAQRLLDTAHAEAPVEKAPSHGGETANPVTEPEPDSEPDSEPALDLELKPRPEPVPNESLPNESLPNELLPNESLWTEEELAKIADAKGIAGLREIATPLGIRGTSIRALIESLLKASAAKKV